MKPLLYEDRFKHVDLHHTNVAATFARIRREQQQRVDAQKREDEEAVERLHRVYPSLRRGG
jgi:hypothetical protein